VVLAFRAKEETSFGLLTWRFSARNLAAAAAPCRLRCVRAQINAQEVRKAYGLTVGYRPSQPAEEKDKALGVRGIQNVLPKSITSLTPHENIYTVPNLLTFSRLIAAPFIGYAILHDAHTWALGLFVYAGVSDLLDGWIARRWKLQTVVGSIVDPMADKILMTVLTVSLAVKGALPCK
jgi:hypothetical protein